MRCFAWIASLLLATGGCDAINLQEIRPGVTTADEVRARMGEPTAEFINPDGSVTYEYSRQPNGVECHMITFGPDRRVSQVEQVLSEATYARIRNGLSRDEVRRLMGKPASIQTFERQREEVWDWRIKGDIPTDEWHLHVHFDTDSGRVVRTSRRLEMRG